MPDGIEIIDELPQQNPYEDKITEILKRRAQPQQFTGAARDAAALASQIGAQVGRDRSAQQILEAVRGPQEERELESTSQLYNMYEQQLAKGDKRAQNVQDAAALITSDPIAQARIIKSLIDSPKQINTSNKNQVLMAAAESARAMGIETDFERKQRASVFSQPKPPSGFRYKQPETPEDVQAGPVLEPIPGGPQALEIEGQKQKQKSSVQNARAKAGVVSSKVDEALNFLGEKKAFIDPTGLAGQMSSKIGGTDAFNLARMLETIQANLGFDQLQAMRDASPTGGALGQVSERELSLLISTLSNLDIGQSTEILEKNLRDVKKHYNNWLDTLEKSTEPQGGGKEDMIDGDPITAELRRRGAL